MLKRDLLDTLTAAQDAFEAEGLFLREPTTLGRKDGKGTVFRSDDLARGMLRYQEQTRKRNFGAARETLGVIEQSLQVEKLATLVCERLYPRLLTAIGARPGAAIGDLIEGLYAAYTGSTSADIRAEMAMADRSLSESWSRLAVDENDLTFSDLKAFYESLPFPIGCTLGKIAQDHLLLAYHALPLWVALGQRPKAAFDFGGGSGLMTSLMAACGVGHCLLLDCSRPILDFARWKDRRMGLAGIEYLEIKDANPAFPHTLFQRFDYGVCTEVLEHVLDVENAVAMMAAMLKKDGLLFVSASFGHYPCPAHLRSNTRYAGKEDDLFRRHGLCPVEANAPIPLAATQGLYQKISGLP